MEDRTEEIDTQCNAAFSSLMGAFLGAFFMNQDVLQLMIEPEMYGKAVDGIALIFP